MNPHPTHPAHGATQRIEHDLLGDRELPADATALNPVIGYHLSTELARRAVAQQRSIRDVAGEADVLPPEILDDLLDPRRLVGG